MSQERDTVGAFVPHGHFAVQPTAAGLLSGLTFAAKDLYDVAGHPTGAGNPTWLTTHPVPTRHAALVEKCLRLGASLVGKVITDELAYSMNGDNVHYGTPVNVNAPGRVPGGSSSGSAAAAAARLCDFTLGTDTGGSIRVPSSFCGVWGIRTTHGLMPGNGVVPLSPSFDTFGWMAADGDVFARVSKALLPEAPGDAFDRVLVFEDAWELADAEYQPLLEDITARVVEQVGKKAERVRVGEPDLDAWRIAYITLSAAEAWKVHGEWIEREKPAFGPAIAARFAYAKTVTADAVAEATALRERVTKRVREILGANGVAILPSAPGPAPLLNTGRAQVDEFRMRCLRMTSIAGLARLPQVSVPRRGASGLPLGVSMIGAAGRDAALAQLNLFRGPAIP